jgi:hypothetical protein
MRGTLLILIVVGFLAQPVRAVEQKLIDAAVDRGVAALKTRLKIGGGLGGQELGATALIGLTLLECNVAKNDPAVQQVATAVRSGAVSSTHTYSIALSILFLDRLDQASDTPLIESLLVRLLAGQQISGAWTYQCPAPDDQEIRRIQTEMGGGLRVLRGGRDLSKLSPKGKRTVNELPEAIRAQLQRITPAQPVLNLGPVAVGMTGDNSNTQFATLALWVGRRYGVPTQPALLRVDDYFRKTQNADGGWAYMPGMTASSATMTCAGVMALALGHGARNEVRKARDPNAKPEDASKDGPIKAGLAALSTVVGVPQGPPRRGVPQLPLPALSGRSFYFLWSLERVAVALELDKLDRKDWYNWGAELLLANQQPDGHWAGDHAAYAADTCFALLFLKKSNVTRDLSGSIVGLKGTPIVLRAGGVGGAALKGVPALGPTGIGDSPAKAPSEVAQGTNTPRTPNNRLSPRPDEVAELSQAALEVIRATGKERDRLIERLRDSKGVENTEALLQVISQLDGPSRQQARHALAERLTRMKESTLKNYLSDPDAEIRRATALAIAARRAKSLTGDLIRLLEDSSPLVQRAARTALQDLTGKNFGPDEQASAAERNRAIALWQRWWQEHSGD